MILAINTSTKQFSLGIISKEGAVISEYILPPTKWSSTFLVPALDLVLRHSGIGIKELTCIAVGIGPGSFTGLKVGLSLVKGICFSLDIPVIGVSSLEALAFQLLDTKIPITAIMDSRKGEYFVAQFFWQKGKLKRSSDDEYLRLEKFPLRFRERTVFIGNDYRAQSQALKEVMGKGVLLAPFYLWHIRASNIGVLAMERVARGEKDDPLFLEPVYLRPPEIRANPYNLAD